MRRSRTLGLATTGAWLLAATLAAGPRPRVVSAANGYSIDLLEEPAGDLGPYHTLTMLLAPTQGRSPNVNVRLVPFPGDIVEFVARQRLEIREMGWTLVEEARPRPHAAVFEFRGPFQEVPHHWYCRIELEGGRGYVVTGTTTEDQWATMGPRIKACVDSFRLEAPGE